MNKKSAIVEAILLGGSPALAGVLINLMAIPLVGELALINKVAMAVCVLIGIVGGVTVYKLNKKYIKE